MARIYSYVVRYDSGFAPNPFYGYCTLATCKPEIRRRAQVGDWVIGSASNDRRIRRGGHFVYAMRVTEAATFDRYAVDPRFERKKPFRKGSRKQSCGDNIYFRETPESEWCQRDSFHSMANGEAHPAHVARDTSVNRMLISDHFIYFGGEGPRFPDDLRDQNGRPICKQGIGQSCFDDPKLVSDLEDWISGFGAKGFQGLPMEWISLREK
jgi:hypothetical protein